MTWADSSERMSPKRFVVTITSNDSGWRIRFIAHASTYICSNFIEGKSLATLSHDFAKRASVFFITFDLWTQVTLRF